MSYPDVYNEGITLNALVDHGLSIARLGDGEFKMIDGCGYVREPANKRLAHELRQIVLGRGNPSCLVGIPTMNAASPKFENWGKHLHRFESLLTNRREGTVYYSAFISRPDSAPWIRSEEFARRFQQLWLRKRAVVVCEHKGSALRAVRIGAYKATHVECPTHNAYGVIDLLEQAIVDHKPEIAILSVGVTATCLANRLAARGIQAIDLGSGGAFLAKLLDP